MANTPKADYPSTMQELYSIADTMYGNLTDNLVDFAAYKAGKYTAAFVTGRKAAVTTAKNLPDEDMRSSIFETLRAELLPLRETCTNLFYDLQGYINDGFPQAQRKIKYEEAGQNYVADSLKNNWEKCVGLNTAMKAFVVTYNAELTAGFMPATFAASVTTASNNFDTKYDAFKAARQTGVATGAKITANNGVFDNLKDLQSDAEKVYRNDAEKQKLFNYRTVKDIVSPPGSASLKVTLKRKGTNEPVPNANVTIQSKTGTPKNGKTDADGVVIFDNIDPDDYTVIVVADGFPNFNVIKEVNTGTAARLEMVMEGGK